MGINCPRIAASELLHPNIRRPRPRVGLCGPTIGLELLSGTTSANGPCAIIARTWHAGELTLLLITGSGLWRDPEK